MNTLKSQDLNVGYSAQHSIQVQNLHLEPGQVIPLHGKNASGKTTFLKSITGFLPVISGLLLWQNKPIYPTKKIIFVPQQPAFFQNLTVKEHLALICDHHGVTPQLSTLLELCDLSRIQHKSVKRLSSGQKKCLALACAGICKPELLALDEPTHELDTEHQKQVHQMMHHFSHQCSLIIFSTHHQEDINQYSQALHIQQGILSVEANPIAKRDASETSTSNLCTV